MHKNNYTQGEFHNSHNVVASSILFINIYPQLGYVVYFSKFRAMSPLPNLESVGSKNLAPTIPDVK